MAGIVSYGAYVPPTRLAFATIAGKPPNGDDVGPERSVAWNDEDAVTMAVAAGLNCLRGLDRASVDAIYFASTTYAFREKQAAALIAKALDLRRDIATADHAGSLRAGTSLERSFGDGAAAFLVGDADAIATFEAAHSVADELVDVWRADGDRFVHSWEDRFVIQEAYTPNLVEVVKGLYAKTGTTAADFARVALYAPDDRSLAGVARALRLDPGQIQDGLFGRLGNAGCAYAPLLLAAALETAKPGERLLLANYGDGAEAIALRTTDATLKLEPRRGVAWHLARRRAVKNYERYLSARQLQTREYESPRDAGLSATIHFREREEDLAFKGQKCARCGAVQFPIQRVCETCFAKDEFELVR
ncbi:MAG: zinc ribbon domain-containing protein, partial [Proteobacteria bacterium]|nr:zinc ribbon domain-containing protein [Pseudomonadota bacterium]